MKKFKDYGKLSGNTLANLQSTSAKTSPDFVLWKSAKPGEPHWSSPWGEGRPGWHIECSAMSSYLLGQPFDIHGGGMDLKFPHHENEIAQSEAAYQLDFAKIWMHVGLLTVEGEKMSKSLGNFVTIRDALATHHPEELRLFMLNSHYRQPADYCQETMYEVKYRLDGLYRTLLGLSCSNADDAESEEYITRFHNAMDDDFATTTALSILTDLSIQINLLREQAELDRAAKLAATLKLLGNILGILQYSPEEYFQGVRGDDEVEQINALIRTRELARDQKNWQEADKIRQQLLDKGIILEDKLEKGKAQTFWRRSNSPSA